MAVLVCVPVWRELGAVWVQLAMELIDQTWKPKMVAFTVTYIRMGWTNTEKEIEL